MKFQIHHHAKFDYLLLITVLLMVTIGTSMIYSASNFKALDQHGDSNYFLKKQLLRVAIGLLLMVLFFYIDYHFLQKNAWLILLLCIFLLGYVLIAGLKVHGSRRSFEFMNFVFQPSEAAKYGLIIFLSWFLIKKGKKIEDPNNGLLPVLTIVGFILMLILMEPDLGTSIIILIIALSMLFISGIKYFHLISLSAIAIGIIAFILSQFDYQRARLISFFETISGAKDPSWQVMQSLISFSNGGLWGLGLGNSKQKLHFLPQPFTDFIYSIIAEETGFIGAMLILLLFLIILWRGMWIVMHARDDGGKLLAFGITMSLVIYGFVSIGIAVNLLPVTGISCPFLSYGGSSLIMNFIGVGILLNISSQCKPSLAMGRDDGRRTYRSNSETIPSRAKQKRTKKARR
ncbi:putative lipid II flippase FtsW [candidate division KSB1 bacterium]|nr:putative lipid II flippase FtsW [candidate division KSB1 bacterium]